MRIGVKIQKLKKICDRYRNRNVFGGFFRRYREEKSAAGKEEKERDYSSIAPATYLRVVGNKPYLFVEITFPCH